METSFKNWLCPNFLSLPKKSELPKLWGGCSPPRPPGPYAYAYIFAGEYRRLLATHHLQGDCIQANVNKIVELNMCLLCRSIQSSFHDRH